MKKIIIVILALISISAMTHVALSGLIINFKNGDSGKTGTIYYSGDSLYAKVHDSIYLITSRAQMGCMHLDTIDTTNCTTAGVYYKIQSVGHFTDGVNNNFTLDNNGKITFVGIKGTNAIGTGVSDLTSDKNAKITYVLYKNGSAVSNTETPVDINNVGKSKSISITRGICNLKSGDYFEIYCKSDNANTIVTHNTLMLTFTCDR